MGGIRVYFGSEKGNFNFLTVVFFSERTNIANMGFDILLIDNLSDYVDSVLIKSNKILKLMPDYPQDACRHLKAKRLVFMLITLKTRSRIVCRIEELRKYLQEM